MDENTWPGIEPISGDKHWHDTQRVCSPLMPSNLVRLSHCPKTAELQTSGVMSYAFAFWWGHDCAYAQPARMAADLCARVPVCVIFIAGQPWWMESCVALLGPLVSLRAEAGHLRTMHRAGGWRPGHTLATAHMCECVLCSCLSMCVHNLVCIQKYLFLPLYLYLYVARFA